MEKKHSGPYVYYRWLVLLLASGLCLLPLWATFMGGFKTSGELRTNAFGLPRQWLFDNYVSIAMSGAFGSSGQLGFYSLRYRGLNVAS
jgi:ABC-type glycerol-3-phosphate transport system permease component